MSSLAAAPNSSTPKTNKSSKSTVYVSHVTPSPAPISNGNGSQNGCLGNSGCYDEERSSVRENGLENSESSLDSQGGEVHLKSERGNKETELERGEEGEGMDEHGHDHCERVSEAVPIPLVGVTGRSDQAEATVPKIMTISASPKMTASSSNQQPRLLGHTRASSTSSMGSPSSADQGSSSSSSLLSHDSSFASREALIEQLQSELRARSSEVSSESPSGTDTLAGSQRNTNEVITQLLEHIVTLKMDLETLKEENKQLKSTRSEMDDELHTLTENLFEEAYKMVDEAKGNKVVAEKKLADAAGKIEAMETEMFALKSLIQNPEGVDSSLSSDMSADGKLHVSPQHKHHHKKHSVKKALKKLAKKAKGGGEGPSTPSHSKLATKQLPPPGKVIPITVVEHKGGVVRGSSLQHGELLPSDFAEFSDWLGTLSSQSDHAYLERIIRTDLIPCLTFKNEKLSGQVLEAVKDNNLLVESITNCDRGKCALSEDRVVCTHRLKFGDNEEWMHISQPCRNRIVAACDFYMCIGHIQKGIVKSDPLELYWRVSRLRAMMSLSRLNLCLPDEN